MKRSTQHPLTADELRTVCDPESFTFKTTADIDPVSALIGQDRAMDAIDFGASIDQPGYNLFALGPQGIGRHTAVREYLSNKAATESAADDWVYVQNFESEYHPLAMRLPAGTAIAFRDAMDEMIEDLQRALPTNFQSDEYRDKRRVLESEFEDSQDKAFDVLRSKAQEKRIDILRTPTGFAMAPIENGEVLKPEAFQGLPEKRRKEIETDIANFQKELAALLETAPALQRKHRDRIRKLHSELAGDVVDASIAVIANRFKDVQIILDRLPLVRADLVDNLQLFLAQEVTEQISNTYGPDAGAVDRQFNRYRVNVLVANDGDGDKKGAPIVVEEHPTLANLVGRIEHQAMMGALITDFTMIRPGALHKANGGYLLLDARRVLTEAFSWEALKRTLRSKTIRTISASEELSLVSTVSLEPAPIPLDVKVVLIGERTLYYLLCELDPEFTDLFKVQVDFDEEMPRTDEHVQLYARLIASIAEKNNLLPLDAYGVANVIEEVIRFTDDSKRLSLNIRKLSDLLREADYWARKKNSTVIDRDAVDKTIDEQISRSDRIREKSLEYIDRNIVLIATSGQAIGQINGLAVSQIGNLRFGRPSRISATVRMGTGEVVDIEREAKLGGPIHSKGVLILSGYLAANYALDMPLCLSASLVFEQSYGGVDGDSASLAELCALLSALADVPISQSFAVTGSINQFGQVQAIGGVNEKVEGFFDICCERGLDGSHAVLIPAANVQHLMLRQRVVDACAQGLFKIYAVSQVSEAIEILTDQLAGTRKADGTYPADSVNAQVENKLLDFAKSRQSFTSPDEKSSSKHTTDKDEAPSV